MLLSHLLYYGIYIILYMYDVSPIPPSFICLFVFLVSTRVLTCTKRQNVKLRTYSNQKNTFVLIISDQGSYVNTQFFYDQDMQLKFKKKKSIDKKTLPFFIRSALVYIIPMQKLKHISILVSRSLKVGPLSISKRERGPIFLLKTLYHIGEPIK